MFLIITKVVVIIIVFTAAINSDLLSDLSLLIERSFKAKLAGKDIVYVVQFLEIRSDTLNFACLLPTLRKDKKAKDIFDNIAIVGVIKAVKVDPFVDDTANLTKPC